MDALEKWGNNVLNLIYHSKTGKCINNIYAKKKAFELTIEYFVNKFGSLEDFEPEGDGCGWSDGYYISKKDKQLAFFNKLKSHKENRLEILNRYKFELEQIGSKMSN